MKPLPPGTIILRNLVVKRVDSVDIGANPAADILLFKRHPKAQEFRKAKADTDSCPECGGFVADNDTSCPSCGEPVKKAYRCGAEPGECDWCDSRVLKGDLKSKARNALDDKDFAAVWTDANGTVQRKLPIADESHAQNAMARWNQTTMPPDVKAKAKKKIVAAAKKFGIDTTDFEKRATRLANILKVPMSQVHKDAPMANGTPVLTSPPPKGGKKQVRSKDGKKNPVIKSADLYSLTPDGGTLKVVVDVNEPEEEDDLPTTGDILVEDAMMNRLWTARWALTDALTGIMECQDLTPEEKQGKIQECAEEFIDAIQDLVPQHLEGLVKGKTPRESADRALEFAKRFVTEGDRVMKELSINLEAIPESERANVSAVAKRMTELLAENDELRKRVPGETDEERLMKSLPESVRKRMEANDQAIAKFSEEREIGEEIKKHAPLAAILRGLTTPEALGPITYRIAKGKATPEDGVEVLRIIKAAAEQRAQGRHLTNVMKVHGSDGTDVTGIDHGGDPITEVSKMAEKLMKDEPGKWKTAAIARNEIFKRHPDLRKRAQEVDGRRVAS